MLFVDAAQLNDYHAPAANTVATKTLVAVPGAYHVIDSIQCSYDAATGGVETLQILTGAPTTFTMQLPSTAGVYEVLFPRGHYVATPNQAMAVALSAPSSGAKGAINFTYRTINSEANLDAVELNKTHVPAADTIATVTIPAIADGFNVIDSIHCGFNAAPGAVETLTVTVGGTTTLLENLPNAAGVYEYLFPRGHYKTTLNQAIVLALSAPSSGAKGAINVTYR